MSNNYGFNKYKQTSVVTASRGQLLLMLYESGIKHTKMAIEAVKAKDLARKGQAILRVQDIINELSLSLNHEVGGDISRELERLYLFMVDQITQANIHNDVKPLETTQKLLETLLEGWKGAVEQLSKFGGDPAAAAASEIAGARTQAPDPGSAQKNTKEK